MLVGPADAQVTAQKQAIAAAAAGDDVIAAFYRDRDYKPIWTSKSGKDAQRRRAFLAAVAKAGDHGLPVTRYDPVVIRDDIKAARSVRDRGALEVELSRLFLQYARDIQSGVLTPKRIDSGIARTLPRRDRLKTLVVFAKSSPAGFLKSLPPKNPEYTRLMKEKLKLEKRLAAGGYGPTVAAKSLKPGVSGAQVVALRNRLIVLGYMKRTASQTYDANLQKAVQLFQQEHGLAADGVAGKGTITEVNVSVAGRLKSIIVAMERERWMNIDRGKRHIWVNLTDFKVKIIDNGKVTFSTRSVVGKNTSDRRSPEFSDVMEHMVINPTWNVPRSIAVKEYLPLLKQNPNAVSHLRLINTSGQIVDRETIDFSELSARNFPFDMKQPPSRGNALGLVKFMFPNRYNIYLHDTPAKNLFSREVRSFSHGCIRLQDPFDFAYALLARQMSNPEAFFQERLATRREITVPLKTQVPVHLVYRTAISKPRGGMEYRRDNYGRDAKLFNALAKAGVSLRAVRS